jgi:hypothetical protein
LIERNLKKEMMADRIYNAIILNEPYASKVKDWVKTVETRMRNLSKLVGDIVICCDNGKSAGSPNAGKAICIVNSEGARVMVDEDAEAACIENVHGRYAYPLSDLRHFSYDFKFTDYAITKNWQGIFQIRIPDFVEIIKHNP